MNQILIIDDDPQVRLGLRWILEREGYQVWDAPDGKMGVEVVNQNPVELVITDMIMPEKEGIETIRELRENHPDIKIIAVSGGGALDPRVYLHLAEGVGAARTLTKPFSRDELLKEIRALLL